MVTAESCVNACVDGGLEEDGLLARERQRSDAAATQKGDDPLEEVEAEDAGGHGERRHNAGRHVDPQRHEAENDPEHHR